jgi:hypothetical protein
VICPACRGKEHNGQPSECDGETWCDCQHRHMVLRTPALETPEPTSQLEADAPDAQEGSLAIPLVLHNLLPMTDQLQ